MIDVIISTITFWLWIIGSATTLIGAAVLGILFAYAFLSSWHYILFWKRDDDA